jgi:hypothetical protein
MGCDSSILDHLASWPFKSLLKAFVAFLLSLGSNNNFKEFLNENNLIVNERTSRLG